MRPLQIISTLSLLLVALVGAADSTWRDAFINPAPGNNETVYVGTRYPIQWSTGGTNDEKVNLYLMSGPHANKLQVYLKIASNIPNNGTYNWTIQTNVLDEPYFALRLVLSSHTSTTATSSQFHLDVLKAENPCYDGYNYCSNAPLPPGWHTRLAILLGSIFGALILACAGCCFCICRRGKNRRKAAEAAESRRVMERGPGYQGQIEILGETRRPTGVGEGEYEMGSREPSRDVTDGESQVGLLREHGERW